MDIDNIISDVFQNYNKLLNIINFNIVMNMNQIYQIFININK